MSRCESRCEGGSRCEGPGVSPDVSSTILGMQGNLLCCAVRPPRLSPHPRCARWRCPAPPRPAPPCPTCFLSSPLSSSVPLLDPILSSRSMLITWPNLSICTTSQGQGQGGGTGQGLSVGGGGGGRGGGRGGSSVFGHVRHAPLPRLATALPSL